MSLKRQTLFSFVLLALLIDAAIGYPAWDGRRNDPVLMDKLFDCAIEYRPSGLDMNAEAEAKATQMVSDAIAAGNPQALNYFIAQKYTEAVQQFATSPNAKTILFPVEATQLIGTLGGIGQLAKAINQPGHAQSEREKQQAVTAVLRHGYPDIHHLVMSDDAALDKLVIHGSPSGFTGNGEGRTDHQGQAIAPPTGYRHYLKVLHAQRPRGESFEESPAVYNAWASEVLSAYSHFQLLCALRKGPWGVEGLNQRIASTLRREKLLFGSDYTLEKGWFEGRPVLVTQNDYGLKLMNGDIGITLAVPDPRNPQQKLLRVAFPSSSAASDTAKPIRWVLPSRLHAVETVFAMTVHKSQGSEFLHTALLLPPTLNPILTRELVYTGITRAREHLYLSYAGIPSPFLRSIIN